MCGSNLQEPPETQQWTARRAAVRRFQREDRGGPRQDQSSFREQYLCEEKAHHSLTPRTPSLLTIPALQRTTSHPCVDTSRSTQNWYLPKSIPILWGGFGSRSHIVNARCRHRGVRAVIGHPNVYVKPFLIKHSCCSAGSGNNGCRSYVLFIGC